MKTLLATSAILLALATGTAQAETGMKDGGSHHGKAYMEEAINKLPKDKADLFKSTMEQVRTQNKAKFEQIQALHKELEAILTAPSFDKDAYLAKSKQIADIHGAIMAGKTEAMASVLSQLTTDERKVVAEAKGKWHHGMMKKGKDDSVKE